MIRKLLFIATGFVCCFSATGLAQNFSERTNDIYLNFKEPVTATTVLPHIVWMSPRLEFTNSQKSIVEVEAWVSSEMPLSSLKVELSNAGIVTGSKKIELVGVREQRIKQSLTLLDGQNIVKVIAINVDGGISSSTRSILVGQDALANAVAIDRKDYALFFATDQYDNWTDLVNPIEDAHSIGDVLKKKYGFEVEIVENPNIEEVFIKLADYSQRKFKPQDQVMIFFAGHGYFDDTFGEGFVVAKNSLENDKAKTTYISHNRLRGVINNIGSEHIFLAMDVCFGGTFDPVIARSRSTVAANETSESEFLVRKLSYKTRKYLTSGGKEYVSDGIPGKHSPFALKLLEALSEPGNDRILTLSEMKGFVDKLKPEPRFGGFGDDENASDFVFVSKN
jgi:hypothetical protein